MDTVLSRYTAQEILDYLGVDYTLGLDDEGNDSIEINHQHISEAA